jgi:hypothetical protein
MADLPWLLLDVDGTLCPLGSGGGEEMLESSGDYGEVRYARAQPARLAALAEPIALSWATSWGHEANDVLSPLFGLPLLPVIEFGDVTFKMGETWKLPVIRRYVKEWPFAWVDDEIGKDAHRWAGKRSVPTLLLDVRPDVGLTQDHVDSLLRFAATVRGSGQASGTVDHVRHGVGDPPETA